MNQKKYKGIIVPAVTPLTADYKIDQEAVEKMFSNFYQHNVMPFVLGTTGEATSLPLSVKKQYLHAASVNKKKDSVLYAGITSNCVEESVDLAKLCFDEGVDVVAATLPSYYALSEDQMKRYFEQLANEIPGPVIIYNIPATTHMSIPLRLIEELSYHENIVGTKDSERSEERLKESLALWAKRSDFCHFLGWAGKSAEALINGSDGLIPSTGNVYPGLYNDMYQAVENGDQEKAFQLQGLSDLLGDLYQKGRLLGESLWALKVLMNEVELCDTYVMPPVRALSAEQEISLRSQLHQIVREKKLPILN